MMNNFIKLFLFLPLFAKAQSEPNKIVTNANDGIKFNSYLNWGEVLEKAKLENKIVFLDCYTTWCAPCKAMERNIYPLEKVGDFFNKHFISVKVQMDKTNHDNEFVRSWYIDAKQIELQYSIDAFPTFLFLSPEGKPLHRAAGAFSANKFLSIAADALNPETQSYTLAAKYDPKKMDTGEMKKVAISIRRSAPELAAKIALAYVEKLSMEDLSRQENLRFLEEFYSSPLIQEFAKSYIGKLNKKQLFESKTIDLLITFLNSSKDRGFAFLYHNTDKIDSVKNEGREYKIWFSKNYLDNIIFHEEIDPILENCKNDSKIPDWNKLLLDLQKKYNKEYADRIVIKAKMSWYSGQKKYEEYCKYLVQYMERHGWYLEFDWGYNNNAWAIFQYSNDLGKLEKALTWSNRAVGFNPNANWMDTFANILYKLGKRPQAIRWESVASKLDPNDKNIQDNLAKMKNGEPTWAAK